jgi:hypothetical protein
MMLTVVAAVVVILNAKLPLNTLLMGHKLFVILINSGELIIFMPILIINSRLQGENYRHHHHRHHKFFFFFIFLSIFLSQLFFFLSLSLSLFVFSCVVSLPLLFVPC